MTIEERLATLEAEVERIKAYLAGSHSERPGVMGKTNPFAIEAFLNSHVPNELEEQVWREIEAEREKEREEARRLLREDESA